MGKAAVITRDRAEGLLEEFRTRPGAATTAAKRAGFNYRTAKKAWETGLTSCPDPKYHRPFRDIVLEEQEEVRARIAREGKEASALAVTAEANRRGTVQQDAIADITEQRAQEERLVRSARAATILLLNNVTQIAAGSTALGAKVRQQLERHAGNSAELSMNQCKDLMSIIGKLGSTLRQLNDAGQKAMEMSRLLAGEPTQIIGVAHLESIPMHEAKDRIAAAQRAMAELEADGIETVEHVH